MGYVGVDVDREYLMDGKVMARSVWGGGVGDLDAIDDDWW